MYLLLDADHEHPVKLVKSYMRKLRKEFPFGDGKSPLFVFWSGHDPNGNGALDFTTYALPEEPLPFEFDPDAE